MTPLLDQNNASDAPLMEPENLTTAAASKWRRLAPHLYEAGALSESDGTALALYCEAWSTTRLAARHLDIEGAVISTIQMAAAR